MDNETLKRLIPETDKPAKGVWFLADGEVARWDYDIAAWKVTGVNHFQPDWRRVVANHGRFDVLLTPDGSA